jgi:hypothetical protein
MQPALTELRTIIPTAPILLGFDRGGAYAQAFRACRDADIDFLTYRRGKLAPTTAVPARHTVRRGRHSAVVILADEQIRFSDDYTGPCRQLTLYEHDTTCPCAHPVDLWRASQMLAGPRGGPARVVGSAGPRGSRSPRRPAAPGSPAPPCRALRLSRTWSRWQVTSRHTPLTGQPDSR